MLFKMLHLDHNQGDHLQATQHLSENGTYSDNTVGPQPLPQDLRLHSKKWTDSREATCKSLETNTTKSWNSTEDYHSKLKKEL